MEAVEALMEFGFEREMVEDAVKVKGAGDREGCVEWLVRGGDG